MASQVSSSWTKSQVMSLLVVAFERSVFFACRACRGRAIAEG